MYKEKVEWLKNAREMMKDFPVCDSFVLDYVKKEDEVFKYELKSLGIIMNSINNNLDDIDYINEILINSKDKDIQNLCLEEMNERKNNIINYCNLVDDFFLKDRLIKHFDILKEESDKKIDDYSKHICTYVYNNSYVNAINKEKRKLKNINSCLLVLNGRCPELINNYTDNLNKKHKLTLI